VVLSVGPWVALTYRVTVDVPTRLIAISATQSQLCLRTGRASKLRIAKASGSAGVVDVVTLSSDMTRLKN
jgi:hypothetical protein